MIFTLPIALILVHIKTTYSVLMLLLNKSRLDYSSYGKELYKHDAAYLSYISTIQREVRVTKLGKDS